MSIGARVRELRTAKGWSQADLAREIGVSQQMIDALEKGQTKKTRYIVELAAKLGTTPEDLQGVVAVGGQAGPAATRGDGIAIGGVGGNGLTGNPAPTYRYGEGRMQAGRNEVPPPFVTELARDVPVYGQVVGGEGDNDADFEFNGQTIDYLRRPAGIAMMRDVFGLYITGSSMSPKFEEGEPIYVSAARPPAIGDYVVIELYPREEGRNGPGYIKRLKRRTGSKIICEQFNPPKDIEFDREDVRSIFRVIPLVELVGV